MSVPLPPSRDHALRLMRAQRDRDLTVTPRPARHVILDHAKDVAKIQTCLWMQRGIVNAIEGFRLLEAIDAVCVCDLFAQPEQC